ncbi:uncharacterized protein [Struthio camelus]|uniref:uncharacterized protein n=1 Tax=Struthio camelus TaxID=8801 RepID=UPI0036040C1E
MKFSEGKCRVLQLGRKNAMRQCWRMNGMKGMHERLSETSTLHLQSNKRMEVLAVLNQLEHLSSYPRNREVIVEECLSGLILFLEHPSKSPVFSSSGNEVKLLDFQTEEYEDLSAISK